MDDDLAESSWPGRIARVCFGLAIFVVGVWWFVTRERAVVDARQSSTQNLKLLRDPAQRPSTRSFAAEHLQGADVSVVPDLIQTLAEGDRLGRELSAVALGRMGPKAGDAAEALTKAANDPEPSVRAQAIVALGRMAKVGNLADLLDHDNADVRRRAAIELGQAEVVGEQFIENLRVALADPDAHVRAEVYATLWKLAAISASDLTTGLTGDPDPVVRHTIVILLSRLPDADPAALVPALTDADRVVLTTALRELGEMGAAAGPAVPAMVRLLDARDEEVVRAAISALGQIGPPARPATEALIERCGARQENIDTSAWHALRHIGRESELSPPQLFEALHTDGDTAQSLILSDRGVLFPGPADGARYTVTDADMLHVKKLKDLRYLDLTSTAVGDAALAEIAELKELRRLHLGNTKVTSQGLRHLHGMVKLRTLRLGHCAVTDEGLAELANLQSLEELGLYHTLVTDAGLPHLARLRQLKWITLWHTAVTDAGLGHLKGLESLEEVESGPAISLAGLAQLPGLTRIMGPLTRITDADLESLTALKRLKTLSIGHSSISDAGMASLGKLTSLESLYLNDTAITDAGLKQLVPLTNLRILLLHGTKVTQQAMDELKKSLPNLVTGPLSTSATDYEVVGLKVIMGVR